MNILMSFLILNPLEALVVIMGCDIFTNRRFNILNDIKYVYGLSTINLIIQILLHWLKSDILGLLSNLVVPFIISPYITNVYYNKYLGKIKYYNVFIVQSLYMITMSLTIGLFNIIFDEIYVTEYINIFYELIVNLSKSIIQILIIFIVRGIKMNNFKTVLRKMASKQVNQAFTWWDSYTPEMPKVLKDEIKDKAND